MSFSKQKARYAGMSLSQLAAEREKIIAASKKGEGIYLYDAKTRRKLDVLAWCVRDELEEVRKLRASAGAA